MKQFSHMQAKIPGLHCPGQSTGGSCEGTVRWDRHYDGSLPLEEAVKGCRVLSEKVAESESLLTHFI